MGAADIWVLRPPQRSHMTRVCSFETLAASFPAASRSGGVLSVTAAVVADIRLITMAIAPKIV